MTAVIIVVAVVAVVIVALLVAASGDTLLKSAKEVDVITMDSIVQFFKSPDVLEKLRANRNLLAVATRKEVVVNGEKKYHLVAAMFDKERGKVITIENALNLLSPKLDEGLATAFDGKDMMVLQ